MLSIKNPRRRARPKKLQNAKEKVKKKQKIDPPEEHVGGAIRNPKIADIEPPAEAQEQQRETRPSRTLPMKV